MNGLDLIFSTLFFLASFVALLTEGLVTIKTGKLSTDDALLSLSSSLDEEVLDELVELGTGRLSESLLSEILLAFL